MLRPLGRPLLLHDHVGWCREPMGRMENRVEAPVQAPGALPPYARVPATPIRAVEQDWEPLVIQHGLGVVSMGYGIMAA